VSAPASAAWLAAHEFRLSWREWLSMMTANRRRRAPVVLIMLVVFFLVLHLPAYLMVGEFAEPHKVASKATLLTVSISLALYVSLMLSQAMESVTRAFYSRADLDLILSSPTPSRRVFAVRIAAIAFSISTMAVLLAGPFIDIMVLNGGLAWLSGYGVAAALGAGSSAVAVAVTVGLFRLLGPRRTRFIAQVVAAVIGAACVIGIQTMAILSYGTLARPGFLISDSMLALAPDPDSPAWIPARAIMGDPAALAVVMAVGAVFLGLAVLVFSGRFGEHALAAASAPPKARQRNRPIAFRERSPASVLRRKEWMLLRRDPWLASQTLTQLLYLLPPALLLARNFGDAANSATLVVLVLVTVAGQLGGGLAWLAISGEDAPELVATAPVTPGAVRRAKVEAVLGASALVFAPLLAVLAVASPKAALIAAGGIAVATLSSIRIQLWFRSQAKRAHFRRRHTSSRIATFAEAFSSFAWAGAAGLLVSGLWHSALAAVFALLILGGAWLVSPRKASA
jgi:ABC-2 type transport system permease protein